MRVPRLNPQDLHATPGYHHVNIVDAGRTAYLAGQCPLDASGAVVGADLNDQVDQVAANALIALAAAGAGPADVVRSVIYVASAEQREHAARRAALGFPGQLVELDLTAALL